MEVKTPKCYSYNFEPLSFSTKLFLNVPYVLLTKVTY